MCLSVRTGGIFAAVERVYMGVRSRERTDLSEMHLWQVVLLWVASIAAVQGAAKSEWWKDKFIYQIYPRSFKDSNGDGIGDLNGITSKLEYLADLNVAAIWISPVYPSPMVDFGYDIANFTDIDPSYGTLADFAKLVAKAKSLGLKVLMDFVPNHSSHEHPWFKKSIQRVKPYDEYYVWNSGKVVNGTRVPPNNWLSTFGGSAWDWNAERGQYYLHQFAWGQPDLNYRSSALDAEMKNALSFWLDRGVDGFRVDAINVMFEVASLQDEPKLNNTGLPDDDYEILDHLYTKNLHENYEVLKSWRKLLDDHADRVNRSDTYILLTEAYAPLPLAMKYFEYGSNVPFNFMFMVDINNRSKNYEYKRVIDEWMNAIPKAYSSNWVVGNHDQHRVAARYGSQRADQFSMIATVLPGVAVIYYGDEIGMEDTFLSYAETVDPAGCNAGPDRYHLKSRDPERTPFQWDASMSAGFSTSNKTWLPVNPNYRTLNLAAQVNVTSSHHTVTKLLVRLKKHPLLLNGSTEVIAVDKDVIGFVRRLPSQPPIVLVVNLADQAVNVDARSWLNIPQAMTATVPSSGSRIVPGSRVNTDSLALPASASLILTSNNVARDLYRSL